MERWAFGGMVRDDWVLGVERNEGNGVHAVELPQLGGTIQEGKVVCWMKSVGDVVQVGEPLVEIETDKINVEVSSSFSGVLRAILVLEGEVVSIGTRIALVGTVDEPLPDTPSLPGQMVGARQRRAEITSQGSPFSPVANGWWVLFNGILLVMVILGLILLVNHVGSASLLIAAALFLYGCSVLAGAMGKKTREKEDESGKELSRRLRFHRGIAAAIFLIGMSIIQLLNGLVYIKMLSLEMANQISWFGDGIVLIGGLYWLALWGIRVCKRRVRF
jgi:biotin-dependent enzyme